MNLPAICAARCGPSLALGIIGLAAALALSACNFHYSRGKALEANNRWEEAAIEYHAALVEDPDEPEIQEAVQRANKVVARENFEVYRRYLSQKQFKKAYARLLDATRQDPEFAPASAELTKWLRVLVAGQVRLDFLSIRRNLSLADEIKLTIRFNTPNPGETIDAEINLDTGTFFVEDLLYDRPEQMLTYYSLNALGVAMVYGRDHARKFTSREFQRFLNFRTPVLDSVEGRLELALGGRLTETKNHRDSITPRPDLGDFAFSSASPHYSLKLEKRNIKVSSPNGVSHFTPRFLYLNKEDKRMFVDFGRYEVRLEDGQRKWEIRRLPVAGNDYFPQFSQNIALRPYFFYREGVYTYLSQAPQRTGLNEGRIRQ